jgi:hypothetical protein
MTPRLLPALILALAALPAQAEVYKWIDAKGQVNYSNAPPPSLAGKAQIVEEQISVMGLDPAVRAWAERRFAAQERQEEIDWQQRQRSMHIQPASTSYYPSSFYGGYYGGYVRGPYLSPPRTVFSPRVKHHSSIRR